MAGLQHGRVIAVIKKSIQGLDSRIFATGLRFLIPIAIIALSSEEELGVYYLCLSFLVTFTSFFGFEIGFYFSKKYLDSKPDNKWIIFNSFLIRILVTLIPFLVLSLLLLLITSSFITINSILFFLIFLILFETASYEIGRFMWNIGEPKYASLRDFYKSVFLTISCILSLLIFGTVLSIFSIIFLIVGNVLLIFYEIVKWGKVKIFFKDIFFMPLNFLTYITSLLIFFKKLIKISGPQFIQNQTIAFNMLLEKIFLTATLGIGFMGIYSFLYSLIQTSAGLFFLPNSAKTKQTIIKDSPEFNNPNTFRSAINFLTIVFLYISFIAFITFLCIPILDVFFEYNFHDQIIVLLFTIVMSSTANAYMSAVSPLYSNQKRWVIPNIISILVLLPYLIFSISMMPTLLKSIEVLSIIIFLSLFQILSRVASFYFSLTQLKLKKI